MLILSGVDTKREDWQAFYDSLEARKAKLLSTVLNYPIEMTYEPLGCRVVLDSQDQILTLLKDLRKSLGLDES